MSLSINGGDHARRESPREVYATTGRVEGKGVQLEAPTWSFNVFEFRQILDRGWSYVIVVFITTLVQYLLPENLSVLKIDQFVAQDRHGCQKQIVGDFFLGRKKRKQIYCC